MQPRRRKVGAVTLSLGIGLLVSSVVAMSWDQGRHSDAQCGLPGSDLCASSDAVIAYVLIAAALGVVLLVVSYFLRRDEG